MSIRFSDLQVILPRSTQGPQLQPTSGEAAAVQQQIASSVSSTVERKQKMVNAGTAVDSDIKISERKQRRHQGREHENGHYPRARKEKENNAGCDQLSRTPGGLGGNIDIKV